MGNKISKFIAQALVFTALVAGPSIWAEPAHAQDAPPSETTYDFEDDLVTGDLVRPDGEQLIVRRRGRLHRRPRRCRNNGNTAGQDDIRLPHLRAVDREHIEYPGDLASIRVVEGLHPRVQHGGSRNNRIAHACFRRIDSVLALPGHYLSRINSAAGGAHDAVVHDVFQRRRLGRNLEFCCVSDQVAIRKFPTPTYHDARPRRTLVCRNAQPICRGTDQLPARNGAYLAHVDPVTGEPRTATNTLSAVLPGISIGGLDDAQRHLAYADL